MDILVFKDYFRQVANQLMSASERIGNQGKYWTSIFYWCFNSLLVIFFVKFSRFSSFDYNYSKVINITSSA